MFKINILQYLVWDNFVWTYLFFFFENSPDLENLFLVKTDCKIFSCFFIFGITHFTFLPDASSFS